MNSSSTAMTIAFAMSLSLNALHADWSYEVGFRKLQAELGGSMPTGAAIKISQVEAPLGPLAYATVAGTGNVAGTGEFLGKTFSLQSGTAVVSWHAYSVSQQMVGLGAAPMRYGMATGTTEIDAYEVNDWIEGGFLRKGLGSPLSEPSRVQNHSWIAFPDSVEEIPTYLEIQRRVDFSINEDNYLCFVGMNNDGSSTVPALMATCFNVVSVGLSNGANSRGLTSLDYDGPGRTKPEIVAPSDATSFATGMVSGAGACLRQAATTINAQRNQTLRAVLLAGATKEEFPNWARTTARPLDVIYGAGELNLYHSFKILTTTEQVNSPTVPVALQGWDYGTIAANAERDYVIDIPPSLHGASLSAVVVWNRQVTEGGSPFQRTYSHDTLSNLSLKLYKGPGSPGTEWDVSDSAVDNLEHVWKPALTSGTYRLRVKGDAAQSTGATIAWRVTAPLADPAIQMGTVVVNNPIPFTFKNLVPTQLYILQASDDLTNWDPLHTFTATNVTEAWSAPATMEVRQFYRLKWTYP